MNLIGFDLVCRQASQKLGLDDASGLAAGLRVSIDEVIFETTFVDGQNSFLLLADVGPIAGQDKAGVYERLLALQLMAWDDPRVRFGFHPIHEELVLCTAVTFHADADGAWLAGLLKSLASQVLHWRAALSGNVGTAVPDPSAASLGRAASAMASQA